jgi:hypothetical protein
LSIINLMATCITPEYPAIYMARTSLMNQAEARGALITGEVGYLDLDQVALQKDRINLDLLGCGGFLLSLPPLPIVGALSHFSAVQVPSAVGLLLVFFFSNSTTGPPTSTISQPTARWSIFLPK